MADSSNLLLGLVAVGGLALGAYFLIPRIMGSSNGNGNGYSKDDLITKEEAEELAYKVGREGSLKGIELGREYERKHRPFHGIGDLVEGVGGTDDVYLITDEDFDKLDIGKKDRRWLNVKRKLRDARLEKVLYGDDWDKPYIIPFAGNVNTISPYGQVPSPEFQRIGWAEGESRTNTQKNTLNLY